MSHGKLYAAWLLVLIPLPAYTTTASQMGKSQTFLAACWFRSLNVSWQMELKFHWHHMWPWVKSSHSSAQSSHKGSLPKMMSGNILVFDCWCNKLPGNCWLKQCKIYSYSSGGQKHKIGLMGLKSRCWQDLFLLEALGENAFPFLVQLLKAAHIPGLPAPSSIFNACNIQPSPSYQPSLCFSSTASLFCF